MAVNARRDDPNKNPRKLFIRESFARAKNLATTGLIFTKTDKSDHHPSIASFMNTINLTVTSTTVALIYVGVNGFVDSYNYTSDLEEAFPTSIEAIEDSSIQNGVIATDDHIAIRIGNEFMIYAAPENDASSRYTYVDDPLKAFQIAAKYNQKYEFFEDARELEHSYVLDLSEQGDLRAIDIGKISEPFYQNNALTLRVDGITTSAQDMTATQLELQALDWERVAGTILDGGYAQAVTAADFAENDITFGGYESEDTYIAAHLLAGYAFFGGLCLFGGAIGTAAQRGSRTRKAAQHKP